MGIKMIAGGIGKTDENLAMAMAIYLLGFGTYTGFTDGIGDIIKDKKDDIVKRVYEYANRVNYPC